MSTATANDDHSDPICEPCNANSHPCQGNQVKNAMCLINDLARSMGMKQEYLLINESGPSHQRIYEVSLHLASLGTFTGKGSSIKKAQQDAATNALQNDQIKYAFHSLESKKKSRINKKTKSTSPAVELNVLAMKKGQSVTFTVTDMSTALETENSLALATRGRVSSNSSKFATYLACVTVFGCEFQGSGRSPQGARHSAAEKALSYCRSNNLLGNCDPCSKNVSTSDDTSNDDTCITSTNKSPISLLHEYATKNDLSMSFEVVSESGPDHLPSFLTRCILGEHEVQASGTSKRISRRNAAEKMIQLLHSIESLHLDEKAPQDTSTGPGEANAAAGGDVDTGFSSTDPHLNDEGDDDEEDEDDDDDDDEDEDEVFIEVRRGKRKNNQQQQQSMLLTQDQDQDQELDQCQYDHSSQFGGGETTTQQEEISSESKTVEASDEEYDEDTASTTTTVTTESSSKICVTTVLDPVQRLNQYCASYKGDVPKYRLIYERYVNQKRREFVMECTAKMPGPKGEIAYVVGIDSNNKLAKKRAAENMLRLLTTGKAMDEVKIPPKSNLAPILKDTTHCANQNDDNTEEQLGEQTVRTDRPRRQRQVSFSDSHNPRHKRGKKDTC